jgi:hypothetical protein
MFYQGIEVTLPLEDFVETVYFLLYHTTVAKHACMCVYTIFRTTSHEYILSVGYNGRHQQSNLSTIAK